MFFIRARRREGISAAAVKRPVGIQADRMQYGRNSLVHPIMALLQYSSSSIDMTCKEKYLSSTFIDLRWVPSKTKPSDS